MYSCVIIDDEQISINILKYFINQSNQLELLNTFTDPVVGTREILDYDNVDFLFLDIRMDISGLDVARVIRNKVKYLIFVTAYEHYALDAFSVNCDRYLMKPVNYKKLDGIIQELLNREGRNMRREIK
ncbi:LytTR family DNA-binding domain-containing protein [Pedobacter sp. BMA]|uniref:LytR/AlgR family response regulator transcription factor n=1 Tax=Pedobacter sp. BMA TaxID=1663685 RepID=UPI00069FB61F|nr:response regulator [Pedobacter sp. BMA]